MLPKYQISAAHMKEDRQEDRETEMRFCVCVCGSWFPGKNYLAQPPLGPCQPHASIRPVRHTHTQLTQKVQSSIIVHTPVSSSFHTSRSKQQL